MSIIFHVLGIPKAKGSRHALPLRNKKTGEYLKDDKGNIRIVNIESGAEGLSRWTADVRHAAFEQYDGPLFRGQVSITIEYRFRRPKSHYGTGRNAMKLKAKAPRYLTTKPDIDKLDRAILDALTGLIWHDDSQVFEIRSRKQYVNEGDRPGATVSVIPALIPSPIEGCFR